MSDQDNLRDAEAWGEARRRDRADSDWYAREARLLFIDAARWQRDQLRTDEATERAAKAMYEDECEQSWDYAAEWVRDTYRPLARTAITALLGDN